jgi:hypothetical protein
MTSFLVQMVKFEFKRATWTNYEPSPTYCPPAPGADSIARADSNTDGLKPYHLRTPPRRLLQVVQSIGRSLTTPAWAIAPPVGTSLRLVLMLSCLYLLPNHATLVFSLTLNTSAPATAYSIQPIATSDPCHCHINFSILSPKSL